LRHASLDLAAFQLINLRGCNIDGINCDNARVAGDVSLSWGFLSRSEVVFRQCRIGGSFSCHGGTFISRKSRLGEPRAEYALNLSGTTILESRPLPCVISLDGFTYTRLGGVSPTDAVSRKAWLSRQRVEHLSENFKPQPFEQLIKVLREMGYDADARRIAMFKQTRLQRRKKPWREPFAWIIGLLWGLSCGYGYRPTRLFVTLVALWLACGALFRVGVAHGGFAPRDGQVWTNSEYNKACDKNWTACEPVPGGKVSEIIAFHPFTYSADTLLPAIDLGQRSAWTPMWREIKVMLPYLGEWTLPPGTLRAAAWAENLLGVAGVILIGAILSGIVKRD
jgi:hypothetical protein